MYFTAVFALFKSGKCSLLCNATIGTQSENSTFTLLRHMWIILLYVLDVFTFIISFFKAGIALHDFT